MFTSSNPATGEVVAQYPTITDEEALDAVHRAHQAYLSWRRDDLQKRTDAARRAAELFMERQEELARIITEEMGKTLKEARGEVALSSSIFRYYAENAAEMLKEQQLQPASGDTAFLHTEAIGPLLGIMPWNYPYYQIARFAAPNLVLGNTTIIKHARNCPRSALAMEQLLHDAGIPHDAYINLFATTEQISHIIAAPELRGVSLTGSEKAGAAVAETAGRHLKKVVLELGGSDPFIVLDDSNLDRTVKAAVAGRMTNAGQACTASKRFIVLGHFYERFIEQFANALNEIRVGDPMDAETSIGPMSSPEAVTDLRAQVDDAVAKGATAISGTAPEGAGTYFPPMVLTDVTPEMRAYSEELFGPVAVVFRAQDIDAAIALANESPFGLGAAVFGADMNLAQKVAARLDVGMVSINGTNRSQPDLPFGGVKTSGVGRELGELGILEFANRKLVRIPK